MNNIFPLDFTLTQSQLAALSSQPNIIISGPAGSGKTFLTILLAEKILTKNPTYSVQIIIYTKTLKAFIEKALKERKLSEVTVNTLSSWSSRPRESDFIIIDEVQDLKLTEINNIKECAKSGLYLLGDSNQMIYNSDLKGATIEEVASALNFQVLELQEIVRYNQGVRNFIAAGYPFLDTSKSVCQDIIKPKIIPFNTDEEQYDELAKIIFSLPKIGTTGIFLFMNQDVEKLISELSNRGIRDVGYKLNRIENLVFDDGAVNILTYHSAKGLEFDNVILPHFDHGHGYPDNIYYVGFSRAKNLLYILYNRKFPAWFRLRDKSTYDGEVVRPNVLIMAEAEFQIGFGIYKEIYKQVLTTEQIKTKFRSELASAVSDAKKTLELTELSEEEIDNLIRGWIEKE